MSMRPDAPEGCSGAAPDAQPRAGPAKAIVPEPYVSDLEPYLVYSRIEILAILRSICEAHVLATVHFNSSKDFLISRVLSIAPQSDELVFDLSPDAATNARLLNSPDLTFVSFHNQVKVQFSVGQATLTQFDGAPALSVHAPRCVLRLQRRMAYRVKTPFINSPSIQIPLESGDPEGTCPQRFRIADISATGFAFVLAAGKASFAEGAVYRECRLEIAATELFKVDVDVRRTTGFKDGFGREMGRVGCRFANIAGTAEMAIQCYVNKLAVAARAIA